MKSLVAWLKRRPNDSPARSASQAHATAPPKLTAATVASSACDPDPLVLVTADDPHRLPPAVERVFRSPFREILGGGFALQTLLDHFDFESVLDVGCGGGVHAALFSQHGKRVTAIDYGGSKYFRDHPDAAQVIIGDFNTHVWEQPFDCLWCSHVLEHQPNVNVFLQRVRAATRVGGIIALTVPPAKHAIVGGHLTVWNGGLLLYNLALAGVDCREAMICRYGYNISLIVRNDPFPSVDLVYDSGDVDRLSAHLPPGCREGFDGDIWALNWPGIADSHRL
ncbi:MAG: Ubiquinone biosynthesis O-methyltransferase [Phycisphaerae bacterium]|nr:Ubiquinone biosynthesis O-methyltransferase [Phycisphaerae bacterium]